MAILFYLVELFVACWFCHAEVYRLRPEGARRESTVFYLLVAAGGVMGTFAVGNCVLADLPCELRSCDCVLW